MRGGASTEQWKRVTTEARKKKRGYLMKEILSKAKWLKTFKKDEGWKIVFKN